MKPERVRLAKATIGAAILMSEKGGDPAFVERLTNAVAQAAGVEAPAITQDIKLDYLANELAVVKMGLAAAIVALASLGAKVAMPPEVANALGLQAKEESRIVVPG